MGNLFLLLDHFLLRFDYFFRFFGDLLLQDLGLDLGILELWLFFIQILLHLGNCFLSFCHLVDACLIIIMLVLDLFTLLTEGFLEDLHQVEVAGGCDISVTFHQLEVIPAHLMAIVMELETHFLNVPLLLIINVRNFVEELLRHCEERFLRPVSKPVDCAAVHQRREHPNSFLKRRTSWTHAQDNVQVLLDLFREVVHQVILAGCVEKV